MSGGGRSRLAHVVPLDQPDARGLFFVPGGAGHHREHGGRSGRATNTRSGAGTTLILRHNGGEVGRAAIGGTGPVGVTRTDILQVAKGDRIDLALTPEGPDDDDACNGSTTTTR